MTEITLEFIARQLERLIDGQARLQDDMTVVMARLDRIEGMVRGDREELRATFAELLAVHRRHDRMERRLNRLEEREETPPA
jgi:hypothetical protein